MCIRDSCITFSTIYSIRFSCIYFTFNICFSFISSWNRKINLVLSNIDCRISLCFGICFSFLININRISLFINSWINIFRCWCPICSLITFFYFNPVYSSVTSSIPTIWIPIESNIYIFAFYIVTSWNCKWPSCVCSFTYTKLPCTCLLYTSLLLLPDLQVLQH